MFDKEGLIPEGRELLTHGCSLILLASGCKVMELAFLSRPRCSSLYILSPMLSKSIRPTAFICFVDYASDSYKKGLKG
jgi:hypothetical protein